MDLETLKKIKAKGYNKVTNAELHKAWRIITGTAPKNNCSECFRRNCWKKLCNIDLKQIENGIN